jgi:hypothetical protein
MKDIPRDKPTALLGNRDLENADLEADSEYDDTWETVNSDGLPDED